MHVFEGKKTEFHFFHFLIFGYCPVFLLLPQWEAFLRNLVLVGNLTVISDPSPPIQVRPGLAKIELKETTYAPCVAFPFDIPQ